MTKIIGVKLKKYMETIDTNKSTKKPRLRIMCNVNAPWSNSGYGVQTKLITDRMVKENYEVACVDFYGLEGGIFEKDGLKHYPRVGSAWGDDAIVMHGNAFKADVTFTLQDIWTLNPDWLKKAKRWIPILPVDHNPIPQPIFDRAKMAYRVVTYSKFGYDQLQKLGMHSTYIQHAVDTSVFKNYNQKAEIRKELKIPSDIFLFGMVAANKDFPPRKSFQQCIDAFKMFYKEHSNSGMYFHTILDQQGGFPIRKYWDFVGLPQDRIFFVEPYDFLFSVGRVELAKIYNCFDVLLLPSLNEGFGVPIIEAQSCEVPVITNNWTAMPELIIDGKTGYLVKQNTKFFTGIGSYAAVPDTNDIYNGMISLFKKDRVEMGKAARKFIVDNYDIEKVYNEKWSPFLKMLENEVYPNQLTVK